jgi:predicted acyl esterase
LLSNGLEALTGNPPSAWLPAVDRSRGAVWETEPLPRGAAVRGITRLHLTVKPGAATGTVIAYLYDVDALGVGKLVAHAPATWTSGGTRAIDLALPATAWDVPAGHRLSLVVDTEDGLYLDENAFGAAISVTGPSWIDVPLR